jgi:hypothetical protein
MDLENLSTPHAIQDLVSSITLGFDDRKQTLSIICDITRAFDCIFHDILISQLYIYDI